ncbi:hypothetical protein MASR2M48_34760 [Spirochaetota bacterium]
MAGMAAAYEASEPAPAKGSPSKTGSGQGFTSLACRGSGIMTPDATAGTFLPDAAFEATPDADFVDDRGLDFEALSESMPRRRKED